MKLDRPFAPGGPCSGNITVPGYEHVAVEMLVEAVEPEGYFAYRMHP